MAEDSDGPSYNHIRYSIVDGNQGSPFTMEPLRGELKVARLLDRERVSGAALLTVFNPLRKLLQSLHNPIDVMLVLIARVFL